MRSTRINIYLNNLKNNFKIIQKLSKGKKICAAVKANAYGHGALEVSKVLEDEGCDYLAVATAPEALELLNGNINTPILLLTLQTPQELIKLINEKIELVVTTKEYINQISSEAVKKNINIKLHLKVDTGMGRVGCLPEDTLDLAKYIMKSPGVIFQGIATHFSTSDTIDQKYKNVQLETFKDVITELKENNINPELIHSSNSGGIITTDESYTNMVRAGIMLYGYFPSDFCKKDIGLVPVLELESYVVSLKKVKKGSSISYGRTYTTNMDEIIAILPIGYADGFSRSLSNCGEVSIKGKNYPIVGRICMDQLMIKVDSNVNLYDKAILIGTESNQPNADDLAQKTATINYEILTNLHRLKKYYIN